MLCDECAAAPAVVDHLDFRPAKGRLRRLCKPCADAELERWKRERGPRPGPVPPSKDRRAA